MNISDEERKFLGFHLACRLEDYEREIKKVAKGHYDVSAATEQLHRLEELVYTELIPESWCGPKPAYWKTR